MAVIVTGDQYFQLTGQLFEIGRQLRQPSGYPFDLEDLKDGLQKLIEGQFGVETPTPPPAFSPYPADGEVFELTLDFDAPENDPIAMVWGGGYGSPKKWKFTGQKCSGVQTRRFKLVRVGHCGNLDEVRQKLVEHGPVPEGQWREAFKAAYPQPDGGPIGIADTSWVDPRSDVDFPFVDSFGVSRFAWAGFVLDERWRWLVPASK